MQTAVCIRTPRLRHEYDNCAQSETESFDVYKKKDHSNLRIFGYSTKMKFASNTKQNPSNLTMRITQAIHSKSRDLSEILQLRRENEKCTNNLTKILQF